MKTQILYFLGLLFMLLGCRTNTQKKESQMVYQENWESLAMHNEEPDWFKDAKFGIYFHWGVYSVPAFGDEWYPRRMYFKGSEENKHHVETYGDPSVFGYHDFVPMFKAEHFDAKAWADLFKKAGARFAGPVAEHHDGFSMWASKVTPWNVMDKGPHRDITGELKQAISADGMKFITTFHHAKNLQRYKGKELEEIKRHQDNLQNAFWDSHYPLFEGTAPAKDDPELNYLYGNFPKDEWEEKIWFGKLKEVIDNYQPDIIWFDSWLDLISEEKRQKFCAYYLNEAAKLGKDVVIVRKQNDLPLDVSVDDLEKSRKNSMEDKAWMTDETLSTGSWCYTKNLQIKPAADILHVLIDIVSKNGVLLLNISPKADGTIPQDQQEVLLKMGDWLNKYGEAIYETRPWYTFGEGPTIEPEGNFKNHKEFMKIKYSSRDIRYTTKGNIVYAIIMGVPDHSQSILMTSFSKTKSGKNFKIKQIFNMGSSQNLNWELTEKGLLVHSGFKASNEMAQVLEIVLYSEQD
jgi:alpha-L-fucosidase